MRKLYNDRKPLFQPENWQVSETDFKQEDNKFKESVFAVANGYIGVRGFFEEGFYGANKTIVFKDLENKDKTITIKLPEGVQENEKIRLMGQGKTGKNGGKNGDMFIKINIEDSKKFKLDGINLSTIIPITPWEAVLGTKAKVESIDGTRTQIYIPNGVQSGETIEIPNKGYKNAKGERGNLIGKLEIVIPEKITSEEKEMFKKLKEISKFNPRSV